MVEGAVSARTTLDVVVEFILDVVVVAMDVFSMETDLVTIPPSVALLSAVVDEIILDEETLSIEIGLDVVFKGRARHKDKLIATRVNTWCISSLIF